MNKQWWEMTQEESRESILNKAVKGGDYLSRRCRDWDGNRTRSSVPAEEIVHWRSFLALALKHNLVDYANGGGLHQVYLGRPDQHQWDKKRWRRELEKALR